MLLKFFLLFFPLPLAAVPQIDSSFSIDLSPLSYPQITADAQSNIIVAGFVRSCLLPVAQPISSCGPLWIAKFDPSGQTLLFATYLGDGAAPSGGFASTAGFGLQTDPNGNIVMLSSVTKAVLPTVNALQSGVRGKSSLYVFKLSADGSQLTYATYLGGNNTEVPVSLAVDAWGAAYILDTTNSSDFPTTPQAVNSKVYGRSVVIKLTPDGALEYSASFPWIYTTQPMVVDSSGAVTLIGTSDSTILKLSPDATSLTTARIPSWTNGAYYYPFVNPTSDGGLWITGSVSNGDLPVTADALQPVTGRSPYLRIEDGVANVPFRIPAHVVSDFAVDPADANRIYAATDGGLFASGDNGMTWTLLLSTQTLAVAVDPHDSNTLYAGVAIVKGNDPGFYRSTDHGVTWIAVTGSLLPGDAISSISPDPNVPGLVYATGRGFYRSLDSGQTWTAGVVPFSLGGGDSPSSVYYFVPNAVRADPVHPNQVVIAGVQRCIGFCPVIPYVFISNDTGVTISQRLTTSPVSNAANLAIDPSSGDIYLLVGGQLTVYQAANSYTPEPLAQNVAAVAFDAASPGVMYEALIGGSIVQSQDGGSTWNPVVQLPSTPNELAVSADGVLNATESSSTTDAYAIRYDGSDNVSYGTYFSGGSTTEKASAVTSLDHLLIVGTTGSDLPLLGPVQGSFGGDSDGFLAEFDSDGTLLSSTYLGGSGKDEVDLVLPLPDGSMVLIGKTSSPDFAQTLRPSAIGSGGTFIVHLRP